jgi:hypothetical protein
MQNVLMILDYEEATVNEDTANFLKGMPKVNICDDIRPKAFVVVEEEGDKKAYISPISPATLFKRGLGDGWSTLFTQAED